MATVQLQVDDPAIRLTLKTMLQAEGHQIVEEGADVRIGGLSEPVIADARRIPTLVLASAHSIGPAVDAMKRGVYGYIFVPLQAGEAGLMVERASAAERVAGTANLPSEMPLKTLEEIDNHHIQSVLRQCKGNQAKAARVLGIGRNTLWRKLKKMRPENKDSTSGSDQS